MVLKVKIGCDDEVMLVVEFIEVIESVVVWIDGDSIIDIVLKLGYYSFFLCLYIGIGVFEVVGCCWLWFGVSGVIVVVVIVSIVFCGFIFGIDFKGGIMVLFLCGSI